MIDYLQKFRLDNKTAFVMGGLGLIGREVSVAFSSMGAKTIILDIKNQESSQTDLENKISDFDFYFRNYDCTDIENLENNFKSLVDEFGCPSIFINCSYPRTIDWSKNSFKDIDLTSYRKNIDIHLNSYAWLARLSAETMLKHKIPGNIIQLGSTYGIVGQDLTIYEGTEMHENMTYAAIKGSIANLTRQMASYYGQFDIRVNTLCPGGLTGHVAGKSIIQNPVFVKQYSNKTPLKRLGEADEVASTALFLASDAASYITGSTIMVDGGWTAI
jgi:NAD(P)-dependent dehydrogenase (short-subunit alcohol dehydrogenase family)